MAHSTMEDVEKVAKIAKLEFSGDEKNKFADQVSKIIGFVDQIAGLDTENISPTTHAVEKKNVTRADEVKPSMPNDDIGGIAPKFSDGSIVVPNIIEY